MTNCLNPTYLNSKEDKTKGKKDMTVVLNVNHRAKHDSDTAKIIQSTIHVLGFVFSCTVITFICMCWNIGISD
jgi:ABC-type multidrug transport system permease subunit